MPIDIKDLISEPNQKPSGWQAPQAPRNEFGWGKDPIKSSPDLERIKDLPRRIQPEDDPELTALVTERIRKPASLCPCQCATIRPRADGESSCIESLRFIQAFALKELSDCNGVLGGIGVGHGKTILEILAPLAIQNCKLALLLCPPGLIEQLITEYRLLSEHFLTPSLVTYGPKTWTNTNPGMPVLHVFPYSKLSRPDAAIFIEQLLPDTVLADEIDLLRNPDATRTRRLIRFLERHPETRFAGWTGSLTDSSIRDYAHLARFALKGLTHKDIGHLLAGHSKVALNKSPHLVLLAPSSRLSPSAGTRHEHPTVGLNYSR